MQHIHCHTFHKLPQMKCNTLAPRHNHANKVQHLHPTSQSEARPKSSASSSSQAPSSPSPISSTRFRIFLKSIRDHCHPRNLNVFLPLQLSMRDIMPLNQVSFERFTPSTPPAPTRARMITAIAIKENLTCQYQCSCEWLRACFVLCEGKTNSLCSRILHTLASSCKSHRCSEGTKSLLRFFLSL